MSGSGYKSQKALVRRITKKIVTFYIICIYSNIFFKTKNRLDPDLDFFKLGYDRIRIQQDHSLKNIHIDSVLADHVFLYPVITS